MLVTWVVTVYQRQRVGRRSALENIMSQRYNCGGDQVKQLTTFVHEDEDQLSRASTEALPSQTHTSG